MNQEPEELLTGAEAQEAAAWLQQKEFKVVKKLSNTVASWFDWTRPNLITLFSVMLCIPMYYFFVQPDLLSTIYGTLITIVCLLCDWLDGALARYQDEKYGMRDASGQIVYRTLEEEKRIPLWKRFFLKGSSHLGKALDPIADKFKYFTILFTRGWNYAENILILISLATAITLTIVRPIKRFLKLGDAAANRFGKYKIFAEVGVMTMIVLVPHNTFMQVLSNIFLFAAMILGFASLAGHIFLAGFKKRMEERKQRKALIRQQRKERRAQKKALKRLRTEAQSSQPPQ